MQDFEFVAAQTVDEVVSLLSKNGEAVRLLSGGTDLIVQLREGRKKAALVVDIKRIPDVNDIVFTPERGLVLGAAVSCALICHDPLVAASYPGLIDAVSLIGGTQIQGRASVGGNVCNASPAADALPALIVHSAVCLIAGPQGTRELAAEHFCTAPGQNALEPGEFLVSIRIPPPAVPPPPPARFGASYLRFIPRNEMDIAVVGAGASVTLSEDGRYFKSARIALGAVAPTPLFVAEAGAFLADKEISAENIHEAARIAQSAARPISDMRGTVAQRKHLALILTRRALATAIERAQGTGKNGRGNGHSVEQQQKGV